MEQNEPSMEEILSSIRRILSHDEVADSPKEELKDSVSVSALDSTAEAADVMELTADMQVEKPSESTATAIPEDMVLLSEAAVQASTDRLNQLFREPVEKTAVPASSGDLEQLVSALLRPYLKEWLEAHLPDLVEKIVQKEVKRLVDKVQLS